MTSMVRSMAAMLALATIASSCVFLERVSLTNSGTQVNADVIVTDVTADGRYVLFESAAVFDAADTNGVTDVFRRDTLLGETLRVSFGVGFGINVVPNGPTHSGRISDSGQHIVMVSDATNLIPGDTNGAPDLIYWTVNPFFGPLAYPVAYTVCGFLCFELASDGASTEPAISSDGFTVAFTSTSTDLVAGDTNGVADVMVTDMTGVGASALPIERISAGPSGEGDAASASPSVDGDGDVVAFASDATNLIPSDTNGHRDVFRWDGSDVALVSRHFDAGQTNGPSDRPQVNAAGTSIAFESSATDVMMNDTNGVTDVFLEPLTSATSRVSVAPDLTELTTASALLGGNSTLGRTLWTNAGQAWVHDETIPSTRLVSTDRVGNPFTAATGAMSADGRYVAFSSDDAVLADDTNGTVDVYLRAYNDPQPTNVIPASVPRGETTTVIIKGVGFDEVSAVWNPLPISQIEWTNVNVIDDNNIIVDLTVGATAELGPMFVNLITPDGGPGQYSGAFGNCECVTVVEPLP